MKNMKLHKMLLGVLVLNVLGASTVYPETWSHRYNKFKMNCSEKYNATKNWFIKNSNWFKKVAICGAGLGVVGGLSWYLLKNKSDRQFLNDVNNELNQIGTSRNNTIIRFEEQIAVYDGPEGIFIDDSLLNVIPNWKEGLVQFPSACNNLQRMLEELQARIYRLTNKSKTPQEVGLLQAMRQQEMVLRDILPRLNRIKNFLNDFKNYFYLVNFKQKLDAKYNTHQVSLSLQELEPIDIVIRDARVHCQKNRWPLIEYCEELLKPDINQLRNFIDRAGRYHLTIEYQQALDFLNSLRARQQDLVNSPIYQQEVQHRAEYLQEQERLRLERERLRLERQRIQAIQAQTAAQLERNRVLRQQTQVMQQAIEQQGRNIK